LIQKGLRNFDVFFPNQQPYSRQLKPLQIIFLFSIFTVVFSVAGLFLPAEGLIGFDWVHFWGKGVVPVFYPPWTELVIQALTWPILIGITLAAYSIAVILRVNSPLSAVYAYLCLPLLWTLFLGQLEGIALMGLIGLPWLVPLALVKPQVTIFAFGARKSHLIGLMIFLILSVIIWGPWMLQTLSVESHYAEGRYVQNIGMGIYGLPIMIATIWFSRGDPDMLMLSGIFIIPHIIPYNLLPLTPAIARLRPRNAFIGFLLSWLPFSANWIGPIGWWLGWLFVLWLWLNLAAIRYSTIKWLYIFK
jgi:hypothetical protein